MPFVVDASVAVCWFMPDERHPVADAAFGRIRLDPAVIPDVDDQPVAAGIVQGHPRDAQHRQHGEPTEMPARFDEHDLFPQTRRLPRDRPTAASTPGRKSRPTSVAI